MTSRLALVLPLIGFAALAHAEEDVASIPAEAVLQRSIEHHDPRGAWTSGPIEITAEVRLADRLAAERGYAERTDRILIDNNTGRFRYRSTRGEEMIDESGEGRFKNYFTYVFGVPMKLRDDGTLLDPEVKQVEFGGREALALRVTYSPEVGKDVWDFYFDPETYALVGCRFFHDEAARDGEYILYEGEIEGANGLRLPRLRLWHMNKDGEYIASDEIVALE